MIFLKWGVGHQQNNKWFYQEYGIKRNVWILIWYLYILLISYLPIYCNLEVLENTVSICALTTREKIAVELITIFPDVQTRSHNYIIIIIPMWSKIKLQNLFVPALTNVRKTYYCTYCCGVRKIVVQRIWQIGILYCINCMGCVYSLIRLRARGP